MKDKIWALTRQHNWLVLLSWMLLFSPSAEGSSPVLLNSHQILQSAGSSTLSKSSLNIWKFMVHVLLKPGLKNFEHYFTSVWDEYNCAVVWAFFGIAFLWDWNENLLGIPPVAKVMRKGAWQMQRRDQASGVPLDFLKHLSPKPESACFTVLCFPPAPLILTGGCPPTTFFWKKLI